MKNNRHYNVIIIGGSYAGLSAAMALGRALQRVLVIDHGKPCNLQTPYAHNFVTHDGEKPGDIRDKAKENVLRYDTVSFLNDEALEGKKLEKGFEITTRQSGALTAEKVLFATGLKDIMPDIKGFAQCWGISVLHCPYCHGYEVKGLKTGVIANGETGFTFCMFLRNWAKDLILFTNGDSTLTPEHKAELDRLGIAVITTPVQEIEHIHGQAQAVVLSGGESHRLTVLYARIPVEQHCKIPEAMGCKLNDHGFIETDEDSRTSVPGLFAAGDNATMLRAISLSVSAGTRAGFCINHELVTGA